MWLFHLHNIVKIMAFTLIFSLMALWLGDFIGIIACGCFISTVRWKIQPFFQFSPWRNPRLRHFSGYPFGTSRKKTSIFFYNTAILLVTPLEFRESASHFLMARPSKNSRKADDPAAGHNAKALLLYVVVSSPQSGGKYSLFLRFSPWRNPRLRHFSGYPFGTSRKKHQSFSITQPVYWLLPWNFEKAPAIS